MLVNSQLLRSMAKKARYSEVNKGHFGLVLQKYFAFYLANPPLSGFGNSSDYERIAQGDGCAGNAAPLWKICAGCGSALQYGGAKSHVGGTQRRKDCYKAEYMSSHLGESYEGMVSGVIERGIFVELPNTVEGMIRISEMPGHFEDDWQN